MWLFVRRRSEVHCKKNGGEVGDRTKLGSMDIISFSDQYLTNALTGQADSASQCASRSFSFTIIRANSRPLRHGRLSKCNAMSFGKLLQLLGTLLACNAPSGRYSAH